MTSSQNVLTWKLTINQIHVNLFTKWGKLCYHIFDPPPRFLRCVEDLVSEYNLLSSELWNPINCKKGWEYGIEVSLFNRVGRVADSFSHYFIQVIIFVFILLLRLRHMFKHKFFSSSTFLYKKIPLSNKIQLSIVSWCNKAGKSKWIEFGLFY